VRHCTQLLVEMRVLQNWPATTILLISAPQLAGILGMSHLCPVRNIFSLTKGLASLLFGKQNSFLCCFLYLYPCCDFFILIPDFFLPFFPEVHVEPHKKQLHVTLAYHFQASHLPTLEKLAQNIDVKLGCDWVATIFSRDIRFANHEVMCHCSS
jgi:hypothetical protein